MARRNRQTQPPQATAQKKLSSHGFCTTSWIRSSANS